MHVQFQQSSGFFLFYVRSQVSHNSVIFLSFCRNHVITYTPSQLFGEETDTQAVSHRSPRVTQCLSPGR